MNDAPLAGLRVLVVEDEFLIARFVEDALRDDGAIVVGPVARADVALTLAGIEPLDAAVLDLKIRGGSVLPVVARLQGRGIPFVLASGFGDGALPVDLLGGPRLLKPFKTLELQHCVRDLCACGADTPPD